MSPLISRVGNVCRDSFVLPSLSALSCLGFLWGFFLIFVWFWFLVHVGSSNLDSIFKTDRTSAVKPDVFGLT